MKFLVTGSAGPIGESITRRLVDAGHDVVGYDRVSAPAMPSRVRQVQGDVRDAEALHVAARGCDGGIHLAVQGNDAGRAELVSVNLLGAYTFLDVAAECGFGTTVIASSAPVHLSPGAFDTGLDSFPADADLYDLSKNLQELTAQFFHRQGLPVTCLRFGHVVRGGADMTLEADMPLSELDYCRGGWVDLDDVAEGCARALGSRPDDDFRIYNVVGSRSGRRRFDVAATERRFGFKLQYDFAAYDRRTDPDRTR